MEPQRLMPTELQLAEFIQATFRSVWALELLLMMARDVDRAWTQRELVDILRASTLVVGRAVEELTAAGLIASEKGGRVRFSPTSEQQNKWVSAAARLYAKSPDRLRRMIASS